MVEGQEAKTSNLPPIKEHFEEAAKPVQDIVPTHNNDISKFGILLPEEMPEDPLKAEQLAARTAEQALKHIKHTYDDSEPDDRKLNSEQIEQVIKQFEKEFPVYADKLGEAHKAMQAGEDARQVGNRVSQDIRQTGRGRYRAMRDSIKQAKNEAGARDDLKSELETMWGEDDPRIDALMHALENPKEAPEVLGAEVNTDMMDTFRNAPVEGEAQSIKMDDGKTYMLWQQERHGHVGFVLSTPEELQELWSEKYVKAVRNVGDEYRRIDGYRQIAENLKEQFGDNPDPNEQKVIDRMYEQYEAAKPDLSEVLGLGTFSGYVEEAVDKIAGGKPDFDMGVEGTTMAKLPPEMRAAVLRHNGDKGAAEALEKSIEAQKQSETPQAPDETPALEGAGNGL